MKILVSFRNDEQIIIKVEINLYKWVGSGTLTVCFYRDQSEEIVLANKSELVRVEETARGLRSLPAVVCGSICLHNYSGILRN